MLMSTSEQIARSLQEDEEISLPASPRNIYIGVEKAIFRLIKEDRSKGTSVFHLTPEICRKHVKAFFKDKEYTFTPNEFNDMYSYLSKMYKHREVQHAFTVRWIIPLIYLIVASIGVVLVVAPFLGGTYLLPPRLVNATLIVLAIATAICLILPVYMQKVQMTRKEIMHALKELIEK